MFALFKSDFFAFICSIAFAAASVISFAQTNNIDKIQLMENVSDIRVEPPNWFVGMENRSLQILMHGDDLGSYEVFLNNADQVQLDEVVKLPNRNYVLLKCTIGVAAPSQTFNIKLTRENETRTISYGLSQKSAQPQKISGGDVLYLIMPDRFANGDPSIDDITEMSERPNRDEPGGKHGGDLQGIIDHLDYIDDLGVTAIWLNPVYENNMEKHSYHGYSITDHYRVDPRLGSNEKYYELCKKAHKRGLKVVKDMIFNHIGSFHYWMKDVPHPDWINSWDTFTRTNYSGSTVTDPHASKKDELIMSRGWFDVTMPDVNQKNPHVLKYLTQQSIWWIEMARIDGIRMDTYPYPDKKMMAKWVDDVLLEYPDFYIVGETWLYTPSQLAYWTKNNLETDYQSNLPSVSDFGITWAIDRAFREDRGVWELYQVVTNDFVYQTPNDNKIFIDNHDMNRSFTVLGQDEQKFMMAYGYLLTTRGIPQYYYGTEFGMEGEKPDGNLRKDMPGGWVGDDKNVFTRTGLSDQENRILDFMQRLLRWRRTKELFAHNNMVHFIPRGEVYVYGRKYKDEGMVVVLNNSEEDIIVDYEDYQELFEGFKSGVEVVSSTPVEDFSNMRVAKKSIFILDLKK